MKIFYSLFITIFLLNIILFNLNCKKEKGNDQDPTFGYSKDIGPDGGTIITPEGFELNIPAGALDEETTISINPIEDVTELDPLSPLNALYFLCGVGLKPDNLSFNKTVTVEMPLSTPLIPNNQYFLYSYDEQQNGWHQERATSTTNENGTRLMAQLDHFSIWGVFDIPPEYLILTQIKRFLQESSPPELGCEAFVQWYLNNIDPMDFIALVQNCCYGVVGVEFNITYKIDEIEGQYINTVGTTPPSNHPTSLYIYDDEWSHNQSQFLISMQITYFISCVPDMLIEAASNKILVGEETTISVEIHCDNRPMPNKSVILSVDDFGTIDPMEIITNANGRATAKFTGTSKGVAAITAEFQSCDCENPSIPVFGLTGVEVEDNTSNTTKWKGTIQGRIYDHLPAEHMWYYLCLESQDCDVTECNSWNRFECYFHIDCEFEFNTSGDLASGTGIFNYDTYFTQKASDTASCFGTLYLVETSEIVYSVIDNVPGSISVIKLKNTTNEFRISFISEEDNVLSGPYTVDTYVETYAGWALVSSYVADIAAEQSAYLLNPSISSVIEFEDDDFIYETYGEKENMYGFGEDYRYWFTFNFQKVN